MVLNKQKGNMYGFVRNNYSKDTNHIVITEKLTLFLSGLLLGDGSLVEAPSKKSSRYSHSDKRKDYLLWLKNELFLLGIETISIKKDKRGYFHLNTKSYREFQILREKWYPKGKKQTPKDIILTPIVLLNWYIGDGSYRKGKNNTKSAERVIIAKLDIEGRIVLSSKLKKLGIKNTITKEGIYICALNRNKFFKILIGVKDIPECYKYKFPQELLCH